MEENKGYTPVKNNGNVRCNESNIGLYSRLINQAKRNGLKDRANTEYEKLSDNDKAEWEKAMNDWNNIKKEEDNSFKMAISPSKFYAMKADRIPFTDLHEIVIDALEEMYNQQSIDNVYNWMKGKNGTDFSEMGRIYTNPTQIAKYIWGEANPKLVKKVAKVIWDLSHENIYLSRIVRKGNKEVYEVKRLTLIITCGTDFVKTKTGLIKEFYSYIQLHPVFFENISRYYIPRRNNLISKLVEYFYDYRIKSNNYKQKFKLPPDEPRHMAHYLYDFAIKKNYSLILDETTIASELNIKEFEQRRISRGRKKLIMALDSLKHVGMIKQWNDNKGKRGQQQYRIDLNPEYFCNDLKTTADNKQKS